MSYINTEDGRSPFALRYLAELFTYRHLCGNLVASDLRTRFRRSSLGILWAVIQPLGMAMLIAVVWATVFGATDYWEFAIYVFSGLIGWEYFSTNVTIAQGSLTNASAYLRQKRVPFIIFQVRTPLTAMVIMFFGTIALIGFAVALQRFPEPGMHLLLVPVFFGLFLLFGIPLAIIMSLIAAYFRDFQHISGLAVQALFFLSPVFLKRDVLAGDHLKLISFLNPMVAFLDMFRAPLIYGRMWDLAEVMTALIWIGILWTIAILAAVRVGRRVIFML